MDYKGLESTFGVPKSSPDPPGKGSTKSHLGLLEMDWKQSISIFFGYGEVSPGTPPVGFASEVWNLSFFSRLIIRQLKKYWFRTLYEKKGFGTGYVVTIYR